MSMGKGGDCAEKYSSIYETLSWCKMYKDWSMGGYVVKDGVGEVGDIVAGIGVKNCMPEIKS